MARTLRHELCHALDREEGLAEALAGELDPDSVDASAYPTEAGRLAEAFALACEGGPPPLKMRAALETRCGLDANPAAAPVRAEVYPFAPGELPVEVGEDPRGSTCSRCSKAASSGRTASARRASKAPRRWRAAPMAPC